MIYSSSNDGVNLQKYAIFVKTVTGNSNYSYSDANGGWSLSRLKCEYYVFSIKAFFFFSDTNINEATNNFVNTQCTSASASYNLPVIKYYSQSYTRADGGNPQVVVEIDITSLVSSSGVTFRQGDSRVMRIGFN